MNKISLFVGSLVVFGACVTLMFILVHVIWYIAIVEGLVSIIAICATCLGADALRTWLLQK